ncbi:MAG TPA: hypothetical protein VF636_04360 [Sphingomonas sp.]
MFGEGGPDGGSVRVAVIGSLEREADRENDLIGSSMERERPDGACDRITPGGTLGQDGEGSDEMKVSVTIGLIGALITAPAMAGEVVPLPPGLALIADQAGAPMSGVELVEGGEVGLVDRSTGPALRLPRAAYEAASSDRERAALLSLALSYRVAERPRARSGTAARDLLTNLLVGATIEANIEERRGVDPRQPSIAAPSGFAPDSRGAPEDDRVALRGVAWAGRLGVCEAEVVRALGRVAALGSRSPDASRDARRTLSGLGLIRFDPDTSCSD